MSKKPIRATQSFLQVVQMRIILINSPTAYLQLAQVYINVAWSLYKI